jgi:hypothetical protein
MSTETISEYLYTEEDQLILDTDATRLKELDHRTSIIMKDLCQEYPYIKKVKKTNYMDTIILILSILTTFFLLLLLFRLTR